MVPVPHFRYCAIIHDPLVERKNKSHSKEWLLSICFWEGRGGRAALRPGTAAGSRGFTRSRKFKIQYSKFRITKSGCSLRRTHATARSCGPPPPPGCGPLGLCKAGILNVGRQTSSRSNSNCQPSHRPPPRSQKKRAPPEKGCPSFCGAIRRRSGPASAERLPARLPPKEADLPASAGAASSSGCSRMRSCRFRLVPPVYLSENP